MGSVGNRKGNSANKNGIPTTGYVVTRPNGDTMTFYFQSNDGVTVYGNTLGEITEYTPEGMTEKQFIQRVKDNGNTVVQKTADELGKEIEEYEAYKKEMNDFLNQSYMQDKTMKKGSKYNRIGSRVRRRK